MTAFRRARVRRVATVLPTVALTALAVTAALAAPSGPVSDSSGQRPVSWKDGSPVGLLTDTHIRPGGLRVTGWDIDPNAVTTPLVTWAKVDGTKLAVTSVADRPDPAVGKAHPAAGPAHGLRWVVPVPEGRHEVCVGARNIGRGKNVRLGCVTRTFDYGPVGNVDSVHARSGSLRVIGWAFDHDAPTTPLHVIVSVDGTKHDVLADRKRPDVAAAHKSAGDDHGFDAAYPVAQGRHTVCVTAVNVGYGTNNSLGCSTVVLNESPIGALDAVGERKGKLHVRGWAYDPDAPTTPLTVTVAVDGGTPVSLVADASRPDVAAAHKVAGADHGFHLYLKAPEGKHTVCVRAVNVSYGHNLSLGCHAVNLDFTPAVAVTGTKPTATGLQVTGWALDPDTTHPITVRVSADGGHAQPFAADHRGKAGVAHRGRRFIAFVPLTSGSHRVCVVGVNVLYGTHNSPPACSTAKLALDPMGTYTSLGRAAHSDDLLVKGWAFDPDTTKALTVGVTLDGVAHGSFLANTVNAGSAKDHPRFGDHHGFAARITADDGEHTVCLTARNVSGGRNLSLGCKLIIAVDPAAPSAPRHVNAVPGYGGATVTWAAPLSDGGAPVSSYTVTASPGGASATVNGTTFTAAILGLKSKKAYAFTVTASNVAGRSLGTASAAVTTTAGPPAQRTPAPVSTSRYIRNAVDASPSELRMMRREGAADARANPSGHGYMVLLDIGGQDQADAGVVLSAGIRFVTYRDLVADIKAYTDGYHSAQHSSAPVTIAIGTNNDMTVTRGSGAAWATSVVNPVRNHARGYVNMTIAGADDIEPGFRADYTQTRSWLGGFLGATTAPFVFNGSADGCSWTVTGARCNNGWTMSGLQYLAGGAAPTRILNLPQIYNTAMAGQWKYISLTGVTRGRTRINFAGPLTELTACRQAGGCGSMSGHSAWSQLWYELQSDKRLRVGSLPYSTDLRIDR